MTHLIAAMGIGLLASAAYFLGFLLFQFVRMGRKARPTVQSVREAIDSLPMGLCFAQIDGRTILTNRRMNELVYRLTGRTVINANTVWRTLEQGDLMQGCTRLDEPWLYQAPMGHGTGSSQFFSFPNGQIWRFRREALTDPAPACLQLEAADMTALCSYSKQLYDNNRRLEEQALRQQTLLEQIVEINRDKELLAMKMRIHDELGRVILATRQQLRHGLPPEQITPLSQQWHSAIQRLGDGAATRRLADASAQAELQQAAQMIGCHIAYHGSRPASHKTAMLFYALVREALTNAVRHGGADRLSVTVSHTGQGYHVEIRDNGTGSAATATEGSGLSNLRRRLEQEGAVFAVKWGAQVILRAELPDTDSAREEGDEG